MQKLCYSNDSADNIKTSIYYLSYARDLIYEAEGKLMSMRVINVEEGRPKIEVTISQNGLLEEIFNNILLLLSNADPAIIITMSKRVATEFSNVFVQNYFIFILAKGLLT